MLPVGIPLSATRLREGRVIGESVGSCLQSEGNPALKPRSSQREEEAVNGG